MGGGPAGEPRHGGGTDAGPRRAAPAVRPAAARRPARARPRLRRRRGAGGARALGRRAWSPHRHRRPARGRRTRPCALARAALRRRRRHGRPLSRRQLRSRALLHPVHLDPRRRCGTPGRRRGAARTPARRRARVVRLSRRQSAEPARAGDAPAPHPRALPGVALDAPAGHAAAAARPPAARAHAGAVSGARGASSAPDALGRPPGASAMSARARPLVSVVVPARNEERSLDRCLASITAQRWPRDRLQVVVVENGSRDRTRAIAEAWAASDPRVSVVVSGAINHAAAMNDGIRVARGEIVARVDAHSHVDRGYVAAIVAAFARHPEAAVVGGPFLPVGETLRERVAGLARSSRVGVGGGYGADRVPDDHAVRSVQCGAYRRDAVLAVGGFDPAMAYGEDEELNWRLLQGGYQVMLCPALRQHYRPRASLTGLWRQYWNYGCGRMRVLRKHPDFLAPRHLAPSALVVALVGLAAAGAVSPVAQAGLALVAGVWGAVLVATSCTARGAPWPERLLLPVAVAGMHVAYGVGLLAAGAGSFGDAPGPPNNPPTTD